MSRQRTSRLKGHVLTVDKEVTEEEPSSGSQDDFDDLRSEVLEHSLGRAAYQDAKRRNSMLRAMAAIRKLRGLSQTKVAKLMGTTQSSISEIESGRVDPQLRTLQRYARGRSSP